MRANQAQAIKQWEERAKRESYSPDSAKAAWMAYREAERKALQNKRITILKYVAVWGVAICVIAGILLWAQRRDTTPDSTPEEKGSIPAVDGSNENIPKGAQSNKKGAEDSSTSGEDNKEGTPAAEPVSGKTGGNEREGAAEAKNDGALSDSGSAPPHGSQPQASGTSSKQDAASGTSSPTTQGSRAAPTKDRQDGGDLELKGKGAESTKASRKPSSEDPAVEPADFFDPRK